MKLSWYLPNFVKQSKYMFDEFVCCAYCNNVRFHRSDQILLIDISQFIGVTLWYWVVENPNLIHEHPLHLDMIGVLWAPLGLLYWFYLMKTLTLKFIDGSLRNLCNNFIILSKCMATLEWLYNLLHIYCLNDSQDQFLWRMHYFKRSVAS